MAPTHPKQRARRLRRALLRVALCLPASTPSGGCSLFGYDYIDAPQASEDAGSVDDAAPGGDAGGEADAGALGDGSSANDANDVGPSNDASDSSIEGDASLDAAADGSALDASEGGRDAADDAALDAARLDAATEAGVDAATDAATPQCDGGVCPVRCNLTGTYALKLTVPTTWTGSTGISNGTGSFEFRFRMRATHVGNQAMIQLQQCGQKVPVIHSQLLNEDYLFTLPDGLFDSEKLPGASATMTLGDSTASSSLSVPPVAMELGVALNDPLNDPWPSTPAGLSSSMRVDVEGDGNQCVTAIYSSASGYSYPRTSTSFSAQLAQQAHSAIRRVFSMTGMLTSCDGSKGTVTVSKLDTRIVGCRHPDGTGCTPGESNYLDTNLPKYQLSTGSYVLSRVTDAASCSTVRAVP